MESHSVKDLENFQVRSAVRLPAFLLSNSVWEFPLRLTKLRAIWFAWKQNPENLRNFASFITSSASGNKDQAPLKICSMCITSIKRFP